MQFQLPNLTKKENLYIIPVVLWGMLRRIVARKLENRREHLKGSSNNNYKTTWLVRKWSVNSSIHNNWSSDHFWRLILRLV